MKRIVHFLVCLVALQCGAQDLKQPITVTDGIKVGILSATGGDVHAKRIVAPEKIVMVDNGNDEYITLVLREVSRGGKYRNEGYLVNLDPTSGTVNWDKKIHHFNIGFTRNYIAYLYGGDTKIFDKKTGKFCHSAIGNYAYIDEERNFAITRVARYIDFATGEAKWYRKIPSEASDWQEFKLVGDSVAYISSKGIHKVRMEDGEGWSYKMKTSYNDPSSAIAGGVMMGVMFGAVGGAIAGAAISSNSYSGYSSNILLDTITGDVYFSAVKELVKIKADATIDWEIPLGRKESSMAILLDRGEKIVHINKGLVYYNSVEAWSGVPYVAAYTKENGKDLYKIELPRGGMRFVSIMKDTLLTRVANRLYKVDMTNGTILDTLMDERSKSYRETDGGQFYTGTEGEQLRSLTERYPGQFIVEEDTVRLNVLNKELKREHSFHKNDIWTLQGVYQDLSVLKRNDEIMILRRGIKVAHLNLKGKVKIDKHILQAIDKETLLIVDLRSIQ